MRTFKTYLPLFAILLIQINSFAAPVSHQWEDCIVKFDGNKLEVGNSLIHRSWLLRDTLIPQKLTDLQSNVEWINPSGDVESIKEWTVSLQTSKSKVVEEESLQVNLERKDNGKTYRIRIFANIPAIEIEQLSKPEAGPDALVDQLTLTKTDDMVFTNVELKDHTDINQKGLVFPEEHALSSPFTSSGNIAFIEDSKTQSGVLFLKLAPLPHARASKTEHDFEWDGEALQWKGPGYNSISKSGYPCTVICYSGGRAGRIAASLEYQRALRRYDPERDGMLLSNTWGDRSRDAKISEEFLKQEIVDGKEFGIDVMQADDGWQRGTTQNSAVARSKSGVWSGFWKADPKFWWPHEERLPNGLEPVVESANKHGLKLGLWYAPDSDDDFGNWEKDADRILELHRDHGVTYFKLDSIVMESEIAEKRVSALMNKVIESSKGDVVIDLDVTAGVRPGYLGAVSVGTVFVENRYTDWGTYWPHKTLRNFWQLSEFIDPIRLRMEFLNNSRNIDKYKGSELAPSTYPPAYLFASVMFSSPLAWFEVSELPKNFSQQVAPLVDVWKTHRENIFKGDMIPIGDAPDGTSWTGFCSIAKDRSSGYAVIFREVNDQPTATIDLPFIDTDKGVEILSGNGKASLKGGKLQVELAEPRSYLFVKF